MPDPNHLGPLLAPYWPHHLPLASPAPARVVLRRRGSMVARAKLDAAAGLPPFWRQRRQPQRRWAVGAWDVRRHKVGGLTSPGAGRLTGAR